MSLITYLTQIRFEAGAIARLPQVLEELAISRPLLISDRGVSAAGITARVEELCPATIAIFLEVPSNPTEEAVLAALKICRAERCDGIVAVGGGSPIDLAKGVALLATHDEPLETMPPSMAVSRRSPRPCFPWSPCQPPPARDRK